MRSKSSSVSKAQYQTRHPTGPAKDFFREPSIQGSAPLTSHGPRPQWKPFLLSCYPSQIKCRPCARALCPSKEIDSFKREGLSGGGPQPSQGPCRERHAVAKVLLLHRQPASSGHGEPPSGRASARRLPWGSLTQLLFLGQLLANPRCLQQGGRYVGALPDRTQKSQQGSWAYPQA